MNFALILSALMLGLASGGHCIAMCGAGSAWCMGSQDTPRASALRLLSFHAGRIAGYGFVGALLGGAAEAFHALTQWVTLLRPLWTMANTALFLFGLTLLITARQPLVLGVVGKKLSQWLRGGTAFETGQPLVFHPDGAKTGGSGMPRAAKSGFGGLALGLSWAFIPCGPLYSAWTLALFAGDPLSGALTGAGFALASGGQLALAQWWFGQRSRGGTRSATGGRWDRVGIRMAGAALCVSAGYAVYMLAAGGKGGGLFCL